MKDFGKIGVRFGDLNLPVGELMLVVDGYFVMASWRVLPKLTEPARDCCET